MFNVASELFTVGQPQSGGGAARLWALRLTRPIHSGVPTRISRLCRLSCSSHRVFWDGISGADERKSRQTLSSCVLESGLLSNYASDVVGGVRRLSENDISMMSSSPMQVSPVSLYEFHSVCHQPSVHLLLAIDRRHEYNRSLTPQSGHWHFVLFLAIRFQDWLRPHSPRDAYFVSVDAPCYHQDYHPPDHRTSSTFSSGDH